MSSTLFDNESHNVAVQYATTVFHLWHLAGRIHVQTGFLSNCKWYAHRKRTVSGCKILKTWSRWATRLIQIRSFMMMFFALIIMLQDRKPSSSLTFTSFPWWPRSISSTRRNCKQRWEFFTPSWLVSSCLCTRRTSHNKWYLCCAIENSTKFSSSNWSHWWSIHRAQFATSFRNTHKPHVTKGITIFQHWSCRWTSTCLVRGTRIIRFTRPSTLAVWQRGFECWRRDGTNPSPSPSTSTRQRIPAILIWSTHTDRNSPLARLTNKHSQKKLFPNRVPIELSQ